MIFLQIHLLSPKPALLLNITERGLDNCIRQQFLGFIKSILFTKMLVLYQ